LVIETHKVECTQTINLSEEEIQSKYDGQLSEYMTKPLSALIATIFKVLTNKKVATIYSTVLYMLRMCICWLYIHTFIMDA